MKPPPPVPDDLTREQRKMLGRWVLRRYPDYANGARLRELVDACLAWHGARGNPHRIVDWYRACQTWVIREAQRDGVPVRRDKAEPEPIGAQLKLLIGGKP